MASNGGSTDALAELPPSAKYVYRELDRHGPLSRQALIERTWLAPSTLDDALRRLESRHLIHKSRKPEDLTQVLIETRQSPDL